MIEKLRLQIRNQHPKISQKLLKNPQIHVVNFFCCSVLSVCYCEKILIDSEQIYCKKTLKLLRWKKEATKTTKKAAARFG